MVELEELLTTTTQAALDGGATADDIATIRSQDTVRKPYVLGSDISEL
jgi:hypothetical protein